ncbi:hypothetical protein D3C81_1350030 [compost metagenome]
MTAAPIFVPEFGLSFAAAPRNDVVDLLYLSHVCLYSSYSYRYELPSRPARVTKSFEQIGREMPYHAIP